MSNDLTELTELEPEHVKILAGVWELEQIAKRHGLMPGEDSLAVMESDHIPGLQDLVNAGLLRARANHVALSRLKLGIPKNMTMSKYAYCLTPEGRAAAITLSVDQKVRV